MNVTKQAVCCKSGAPDKEELELINRFSRKELTAEEVYTFAVRLCDNEVDRDGERFSPETLEELAGLFVGKTGIFDHSWTAAGQTARIYRAEVAEESGAVTAAGDPCRYVKGYAYLLRTPGNRELIAQLDGGILREVSVGCAVRRSVCSICGQQAGSCGHEKGQYYGGKLCYTSLEGAADAFEWSFVAVPAQPKSGVMKSLRPREVTLRQLADGCPECAGELERLEKEALLGRRYLASLRAEVVRLAGLDRDGAGRAVMERIAGRLEEPELLELKRVYAAKAAQRFPLAVQLDYSTGKDAGDAGDGAFLI